MKKMIAIAAAALIGLPALAAAQIEGQCADCHTMHNSEQGVSVAVTGVGGDTQSDGPIQNLLRMDCIACHAQDPDGPNVAVMDGGSRVPQVYHSDPVRDLAAGNFRYITDGGVDGNRKGHNVVDLFPGGDDTGAAYIMPPGKYQPETHANVWNDGATPFGNFTCAGAAGCHGTRSQLLSGDAETGWVRRTGIPALSGAHHQGVDGLKDPAQNLLGVHDGDKVAAGYRFIPGLKGTGNTAAPEDRWQNISTESHNEYYGMAENVNLGGGTGCDACHIIGTQAGPSPQMSLDSTLKVPNQSMSGFCVTCHGNFHSSGTENGSSGAFLRHPSDYVIPNRSEYQFYTEYNITAPVARPTVVETAGADVSPGTDLVMCLSCHQAHATQYNGMLRFDYTTMVAGFTTARDGCFACHTSKGARQ